MKIHFIGICGVAMSALAIALHKQGHTVTGSDKGFFPPVSTNLKEQGVSYYPGWHPEKMGTPDLVVVGNVAGSTNPEWQKVQKENIPYKSYPEVIHDFSLKENSIVCAGTYGKTTTTALLTHILQEAGEDPSYMFGGLKIGSGEAAHIGKSDWSIIEGDEYKSARWDNKAKFYHYAPTHLLLTAVVWDHADVYPTEEAYKNAFRDLVEMPQKTVASTQALSILKKIPYATSYGPRDADYVYTDIEQSKDGLSFHILHEDVVYTITSKLIGVYMADNITACFAMAKEIGLGTEQIISAIASFPGIKRRLEKRLDGPITIFDDIAHSPTKATAILETLHDVTDGKIIAVFEPNTGNRKSASFPSYSHAFDATNEVIIPKLTQVKIAEDDTDPPVDGKALTDVIREFHKKVTYIDKDELLVQYLIDQTKKGDYIAFLGSHGFRGMIDETIKRLS